MGSGTALGIIAGNLLPLRVVSALSVALYGMIFGYHHPAGSQRPDRCGAGRHQLCAELSVRLSAGHLGTLRGYPHHSFNGGDLRRSSGAVPGQAGGKRR